MLSELHCFSHFSEMEGSLVAILVCFYYSCRMFVGVELLHQAEMAACLQIDQ